MKCEKCKEKEASFFYSCNLNGKKTEKHLCADCARAEGFGEVMDYRSPVSMFDDMFDGFFDDFFAPHRSLFSHFDSFGLPMRSMMTSVLPRLHVVLDEPRTEEQNNLSEAEKNIPGDAGAEVKSRREITALKHQLKEAVKAENFEKAIELRDKLRELEK